MPFAPDRLGHQVPMAIDSLGGSVRVRLVGND